MLEKNFSPAKADRRIERILRRLDRLPPEDRTRFEEIRALRRSGKPLTPTDERDLDRIGRAA